MSSKFDAILRGGLWAALIINIHRQFNAQVESCAELSLGVCAIGGHALKSDQRCERAGFGSME
jgi:hypothetical protein